MDNPTAVAIPDRQGRTMPPAAAIDGRRGGERVVILTTVSSSSMLPPRHFAEGFPRYAPCRFGPRMRQLFVAARAFLWEDRGQDLLEYGLLASLIAVVVMIAVGDVGGQLTVLWTHIVNQLEPLL